MNTFFDEFYEGIFATYAQRNALGERPFFRIDKRVKRVITEVFRKWGNSFGRGGNLTTNDVVCILEKLASRCVWIILENIENKSMRSDARVFLIENFMQMLVIPILSSCLNQYLENTRGKTESLLSFGTDELMKLFDGLLGERLEKKKRLNQ
ncbi:MAG: hypothetical protein LBU65_09350 [Planctomycetaceae bacterium]|jgi:hypothetical protein|nr:hypothetical protein [Planctomycetaceae bacterium]